MIPVRDQVVLLALGELLIFLHINNKPIAGDGPSPVFIEGVLAATVVEIRGSFAGGVGV